MHFAGTRIDSKLVFWDTLTIHLLSPGTQHIMPVDFGSVRLNAAADGIPASEIAVFYQGLTPAERLSLKDAGLMVHETEGTVIARLAADGNQPFPEKAIGVHTLAA